MKKNIPSYVPKGSIKWLVGRLHVGVPDAEIETDIRKRLAKNNATEKQIQACVDYALDCHHENRNLYRRVMGGAL